MGENGVSGTDLLQIGTIGTGMGRQSGNFIEPKMVP